MTGTIPRVRTIADLVDPIDLVAQRPRTVLTGLRDLDTITGGLEAGRLWVLTGAPGQGRTTLATQWALLTATATWGTTLICPREPLEAVRNRLLANSAKVPLLDLQRSRPVHEDRLAQARRTLAGLRMKVAALGDSTWLTIVGGEAVLESGEVLVVDDADLAPGISAARMRAIADRGVLVILTMPRHVLVKDGGSAQWLDPDWARSADAVLEIRQASWPDHVTSLRPGEADLFVLKNRWGPTVSTSVLFQGHFARFIGTGE